MIEILKIALQYKEAGVALFFAILFYMDMRKKINSMNGAVTKMDNHITNHVVTALKDIKVSIDRQTELLDKKLKGKVD